MYTHALTHVMYMYMYIIILLSIYIYSCSHTQASTHTHTQQIYLSLITGVAGVTSLCDAIKDSCKCFENPSIRYVHRPYASC